MGGGKGAGSSWINEKRSLGILLFGGGWSLGDSEEGEERFIVNFVTL